MNKVVTFGEIMLRLATPGFLRFSQATELEATFGGGEANVAVSLANFGMDARFVSSLPKNDIGDAAIAALRARNVDTSFIHRGGERIGIYFLETGAVSRGSKVIYDRAHSSFANLKKGMIDWDKALDGATWFHWTGITPAVSEGAAEVCLEACEAAAAKGITISTDLNYRNKLWKWGKTAGEVMKELVKHCDIILGNEEDAEAIYNILENEVIPLYYKLNKDGVPVEWVKIMKEAIKSTAAKFSARRMAKEYALKFYQYALRTG